MSKNTKPFAHVYATPALRLAMPGISGGKPRLQQRYRVIYNPGRSDETSELVWLNVREVEETREEERKRVDLNENYNVSFMVIPGEGR